MAGPTFRGGQGFGRRTPCAGWMGDRPVKGRSWRFGVWAVAVALTGCGGGTEDGAGSGTSGSGRATRADSGVPKLLFITNSNADWWNAVEKGMHDGAKELGA